MAKYTKVSLLGVSGYKLTSTLGEACDFIMSSSECKSAAEYLGLPTTEVIDDKNESPKYDPPYCYFENNILKYNYDGTNTGECGGGYKGNPIYVDRCLCRKGMYTPRFFKTSAIARVFRNNQMRFTPQYCLN